MSIQITIDHLRIATQEQFGALLWQLTVLQAENAKLKADLVEKSYKYPSAPNDDKSGE